MRNKVAAIREQELIDLFLGKQAQYLVLRELYLSKDYPEGAPQDIIAAFDASIKKAAAIFREELQKNATE
jgi:hypothetical protein